MKKISILMPTYNDADMIIETLNSILNQTYTEWELIIIDDGSTDNTKQTIKKYKEKKDKDNKIKYIYQTNQDQLLAIINGLNYASGDYIYILHSDDLLNDNNVFFNAIEYMEKNPQTDVIISNLTIIDAKSNVTGIQKVNPYLNKKRVPAIQLLWLGRNIYTDLGFYRKAVFRKNVYNNYLTWNRPFWLNIEDKVTQINIDKVKFNLFKYRIYEGNYANNEIGKLCLLNGSLRTATELMKFYNVPLYKFQYIIYRVFCHLHLFKFYFPIYQEKETKNKSKIVDFIIRKKYPNGYDDNIFLKSLFLFYKNTTNRKINFDKIYNGTDIIYKGNNMRKFNNELLSNNLPQIYYDIFKEMQYGFDEIIVSNNNYGKVVDLMKFLCIHQFVKIRRNNNAKKTK